MKLNVFPSTWLCQFYKQSECKNKTVNYNNIMVVLVYNPHTRLSCQSGRYYHIQYSLLCFGPRFVMKYVYFNLGKIPK
jgi:hypothetical protein